MAGFLLKTIKWHLYKKYVGSKRWRSDYIFERALRQVTVGDVCIDLGANVGRYTVMMAQRGAKVYAFEPHPLAHEALLTNTRYLNGIEVINAAAGTSEGEAKLFLSSDATLPLMRATQSSSMFSEKTNVSSDQYVQVKVVDFGAFLRSLDCRVRLIKVDIEGAEVPLLEALLEKDVLDKIDFIFVETHEDRIPELRERTEKLRAAYMRRFGDRVNFDWH